MKLFLKKQKPQVAQFGITFLLLLTLFCIVMSCKKETTIPEGLTPYTIAIPKGFPKIEIPQNNEPYAERIVLGRKLYYDPILSNDGRACASCHHQDKGFTISTQNKMPVLHHTNLAWKDLYMWDGRESGTLEDVMHFEVTEFFGTDISKLNKHPEYPELFAEAYNISTITADDVAKALAQFVRTLISANSKYDQVMAGKTSFTEKERKGYDIFNSERGSCYHCHVPPLFADNLVHNTGLDSTYEKPTNQGYYSTTGDSAHLGHMRTANLRNIELRTSFMHDGRFSSIKDVLEHYSKGVKISPSLDPVMIKSNGSGKLHFTPEELEQLEAFLKTLTDTVFTSNPNLSHP